jgi:hypothetical protein
MEKDLNEAINDLPVTLALARCCWNYCDSTGKEIYLYNNKKT